MVSCRWLVMIRVFLVVLAAVLIQGCGLKADPSPRRIQSLVPAAEIRLQETVKYDVIQDYASGGSDELLEKDKRPLKNGFAAAQNLFR